MFQKNLITKPRNNIYLGSSNARKFILLFVFPQDKEFKIDNRFKPDCLFDSKYYLNFNLSLYSAKWFTGVRRLHCVLYECPLVSYLVSELVMLEFVVLVAKFVTDGQTKRFVKTNENQSILNKFAFAHIIRHSKIKSGFNARLSFNFIWTI